MGARHRTTLIRCATAIAGAALVLGLSSTAAGAADRQDASFEIVAFGIQAEIAEQGPNHAVIDWTFGTAEFGSSSPDLGFGHPGFRMTWNWNKEAARGTIRGTLTTSHFFLPIRWEGEFWGRMTEAGGEGTLHMTEVNTGRKLRATWTLPPLDPLGDVFGFLFEATGTVTA